jgi:hypothetical protein
MTPKLMNLNSPWSSLAISTETELYLVSRLQRVQLLSLQMHPIQVGSVQTALVRYVAPVLVVKLYYAVEFGDTGMLAHLEGYFEDE